MKKIILAFALSILTSVAYYAQITHTSQFVKIVLPKGFYKLSDRQVDSVRNIKPRIAGLPNAHFPYQYKTGFILLSLNEAVQNPAKDHLAWTKQFMDEGYKFLKEHNNQSYKSEIKKSRTNQVLVFSYILKKTGHYEFDCQNATNTLSVSGKIECPEEDVIKADALLNEILNKIQFTK